MYGYETPKYFIPAQVTGDMIEASEEQRAAGITDTQIYGLMRATNRGHGVIATGTALGTFVSGASTVTFSENKPQYAVEALINQVYAYSINPFTFSGIPDDSVSYLYIRLVEQEIGKSSVERGEFVTYVSASSTAPSDGILIATATTTSTTITIDTSPTGLITIPILSDHVADNTDPHGTTLYQTNLIVDDLVASGTASFNNIEADILSGTTAYFTELLSGSGSIRFNSLIISGSTVINGDVNVLGGLAFSNGITFAANVDVESGITIDGRDISADGIVLDSHVANMNNPHATTAVLAGALSKYGDTLSGNLLVQSGNTIDGIDISTLEFLYDGSDATGKHTHSELLPQSGIETTLLSPEYNGAVLSGTDIALQTIYDDTSKQNVYEVTGISGTNVGIIALRHGISETTLSTPNDFLKINGQVQGGTANRIEILCHDTNDVVMGLTGNSITDVTMTENVVSFSGAPTLTNGEFMTIFARLECESGTWCRLGDLGVDRWEDYTGV